MLFLIFIGGLITGIISMGIITDQVNKHFPQQRVKYSGR